MSELVISGLRASVGGSDVLRGIDLTVRSGEVHAVMGPNGSGKSTLAHVLLGKPGYEVTDGTVTLDGTDLLGLPPHERVAAGLFGALQYPIEVPGVALADVLGAAFAALGRSSDDVNERLHAEAERIGFDRAFLDRSLNVDLSGGEKKRNEVVQLGVLEPKIAVLDELDSGLDVDALRTVSARVEAATNETDLGVLAITHYTRLLEALHADHVHVLAGGTIVDSGGPELADRLEAEGYAAYGAAESSVPADGAGPAADPFADPLS